ncbi:15-hydroxyprostaglandin dehydrogenase [NAD(+)]-like [Ostrinia nubilalis]|uniref:15-hydroxyprostaglandin dehydrogenase [NAD(+)]-like n=1 Tax=Ostrinia nubilalis TaxID=29057 RepID=UPI0030825C80
MIGVLIDKKLAILDIDEPTGKATAERLNRTYLDKVLFVKCDVSKEEDIEAAFKEVVEKFGNIDVLVNNAGVMSDAPHMWRKSCDINWQGTVSFTLKALAHMRKDEGGKGGTIINIASAASFEKVHIIPIYCGSKAAVLHFTRTIANQPDFVEITGIRILVIGFGPTATPLMADVKNKVYEAKLGKPYEGVEVPCQKVESAVNAFFKMFKEGENGSVWMSVKDKPVKNFTPYMEKFLEDYMQILYNDE